MTGKTIRLIVHRKTFNFQGVDRISILGATLNDVNSPIPFAEKEVDEVQMPYDKARRRLDGGDAPFCSSVQSA